MIAQTSLCVNSLLYLVQQKIIFVDLSCIFWNFVIILLPNDLFS